MEAIRTQLRPEQVWGIREEPRIAEQQFGNFQVNVFLQTHILSEQYVDCTWALFYALRLLFDC